MLASACGGGMLGPSGSGDSGAAGSGGITGGGGAGLGHGPGLAGTMGQIDGGAFGGSGTICDLVAYLESL